MRSGILTEIGLARCPPFYRDIHFLLAVAGGGVGLGLMAWLLSKPPPDELMSATRLALVVGIWYPALEEVLFRGVIQGQIGATTFGQRRISRLSVANWLTSFLFAAIHAIYQPAIWAIAIIVPSLVFGHLRDRFASIYPAFALHSIYNLGFIFVQFA